MAESVETDLVVLGAGPGGYAAAFLAADKGMQDLNVSGSRHGRSFWRFRHSRKSSKSRFSF